MSNRAIRFTVVGLGGFLVQLSALWWLTRAGWSYLPATIVAVEGALLHNFWWHVRWTWGDRTDLRGGLRSRLARFQASTGVASIGGSLLFTTVLVEMAGFPAVAANAVAVGLTAIVNYASADRWVFPCAPAAAARQSV